MGNHENHNIWAVTDTTDRVADVPTQNQESLDFWNDEDMANYFAKKPADPRIVELLNTFYADIDNSNVHALDLGCGGGRHSQMLAELGLHLSSVDINEGMREATARRLERSGLSSDIREGSIQSIPYEDDTFGVIVTTGVLHQARSFEEYRTCVQELSRVTKSGGIVALNIFTNAVWDDTYKPVEGEEFTITTQEGLLMTVLPKEIFVELMDEAGFTLFEDQGEDIKRENTGPRAVFRAVFMKR